MELNPIKILNDLLELLAKSGNKGIANEIVPRLGILIIYVWLALEVLKKVLEMLASCVESLNKLGLHLKSNQDQKLATRRRQQFCNVLRSDLDAIAKAENWNDQWFTDLEAEVEAEGGYYSNALSRLLRHRSNGIRRVPSLIQAIQTSTERCMLLVGDPGCGKSVALRHLGRTLADEGGKSTGINFKVPLYINLKELPACKEEELTPDYIEKFVIEHIRRGDSDTAAYVRDHWQDYKVRGIWFFLFDSFDEIPAVLHAPNGSKTIEQYSHALRQFMDGMGACRGVLASREYKGPEVLPWQKLRILQLNQQRQDELIDNTYLSNQHKTLVRQHLATMGSSIFGNPLFLSLLCRYVGDTQKVPANDYDLLLRHIERLAERDPDFILKQYGLNELQLLEGATLLAVLFAEEPELSLAPKHDEITHALRVRQTPLLVDLESLLSALIDVKIGRSDVKEARPGDRRFTFSHRRYQETLFVQYLAQHPQHISTENLLLDSRWREFTVTLIQSQSADVVKRFADEAVRKIDSLTQSPIAISKELGEGLHYFEWHSGSLLHLLQLVNEGFSKRLELVPENLREAISRQLLPRWESGDLYDKLMVVRHGCLLPVAKYQEILEWAIVSGIDPFLQASFMNAQFLTALSDSLGKWIRQRFANETLVSNSKIELFKLDALGNRLPTNLGAPLIFQRCKTLRSILYQPAPIRFLVDSMNLQIRLINMIMIGGGRGRRLDVDKVAMVIAVWFYISLIPLTISAIYVYRSLPELVTLPMVAMMGSVAIILALFTMLLLRAEPAPLTPLYFIHRLTNIKIFNGPELQRKFVSMVVVLTVLALFIWVTIKLIISFPGVLFLLVVSILIGVNVSIRINKRNSLKRLNQTITNGISIYAQVRQASSARELSTWLENKSEDWLVDSTTIRSILRYVELHFKGDQSASTVDYPKRILIGYLLSKLES
jgi:NACHT domain